MRLKIIVCAALFLLMPSCIVMGLDAQSKANCLGWDCDTVYCPDGYAVKTPDGYLPCEQFNQYINTGAKEILK